MIAQTEQTQLAAVIADQLMARIEARFSVQPTLTLDQAATALGLSVVKVRQLCANGELPHIRVDKFYRIKPADVNAYLERNYHHKRSRTE